MRYKMKDENKIHFRKILELKIIIFQKDFQGFMDYVWSKRLEFQV